MEADKEPICLIDPWHIWPCRRDCNIAVIPQQLQGAALWARCVGFKGSKRSQPCGKEKCWGFFKKLLALILARYLNTNAHNQIACREKENHISPVTSTEVYTFTFTIRRNLCLAKDFQCHVYTLNAKHLA